MSLCCVRVSFSRGRPPQTRIDHGSTPLTGCHVTSPCCVTRAFLLTVIPKPRGLVPTNPPHSPWNDIPCTQIIYACSHNLENNESQFDRKNYNGLYLQKLGGAPPSVGLCFHGYGSNDVLTRGPTYHFHTPFEYFGWLVVYPTLVSSVGVPTLWLRWRRESALAPWHPRSLRSRFLGGI